LSGGHGAVFADGFDLGRCGSPVKFTIEITIIAV